ncbi:hypothetical protein PVIIG_06002 [Plasmodium vivax India VII]|uniref:VIR protein n=1 Tax=Plasmodium vivax India VII TaxID=1077284 RepID=A0A0J9S9K0_PLAVI|nr:hypothetical protein PVIIG_06002 [Plasmodium vivax India VII]
MTTRGYRIFGTANNMFKQYREKECIGEYITSKNKIKQQIDELQKSAPSYFCGKCSTIKTHIIAENNRINKCFPSNSKSLKLIEDDDIKGFIEECIDYEACVLKRTRLVKKNCCTRKSIYSPIKGPQRQDHNRAGGKAITKAEPMPQKPDGMDSPRNSGENQAEAIKQITNASASTSGRIETQEKKISPSLHPPVSETDSHSSASIHGTSDGAYDSNKPSHAVDVREDKAKNNILVDKIVDIEKFKNQDEGGEVAVIVISGSGDTSVVREDPDVKTPVDRNTCDATTDRKEPCQTNAVMIASRSVSSSDLSSGNVGKDHRASDENAHGELSVHVSNDAEIILDEFTCSEYDFDEVFSSETHNSGLHEAKMKLNTAEITEHAVSPQGHMASISETDSEIKTCQSTDPILSSSGCNTLNSVSESSYSLKNEICSKDQISKDHVSCRQNSHQGDQLHQREFEQQKGQLHNKEELSLQEEDRSGCKHYIIEDIFQLLHLQKHCSLRQSIYFPRWDESIYTNKFIYT